MIRSLLESRMLLPLLAVPLIFALSLFVALPIILAFSSATAHADDSLAFDGLEGRGEASILTESGCDGWIGVLDRIFAPVRGPRPEPRDGGYALAALGERIAGSDGGDGAFSPRHDGPGLARGLRIPHSTGDEEARIATAWFEGHVAPRLWYGGLSPWKRAILGPFSPDETAPLPLGFERMDFDGSTAPVTPCRMGHLASAERWMERLSPALKALGPERARPVAAGDLVELVEDRLADEDRGIALLRLRPADGGAPGHLVVAHAMHRCTVRPRCNEHRHDAVSFPATAIVCLDLDPQIGSGDEGQGRCLLVLDGGLLCIDEDWREALETQRSLSFQDGHRCGDDAVEIF